VDLQHFPDARGNTFAAGFQPGGFLGLHAVQHRGHGVAERGQIVAAFQEKRDPAARVLAGQLRQRVGDDADREEVYGTERQLLYVACTRARDRLLVTGVDPGSEFLDDLRGRE